MNGRPLRIQRKRRRGWRMPEGAVYVGRPSRWGNPYAITRSSDYHGLAGSWYVLGPDGDKHHPELDTESSARRVAVDLFAADLAAGLRGVGEDQVRAELSGHDLVCWCPLDQPCHADVLLAVAARPAAAEPAVPADGQTPSADLPPRRRTRLRGARP